MNTFTTQESDAHYREWLPNYVRVTIQRYDETDDDKCREMIRAAQHLIDAGGLRQLAPYTRGLVKELEPDKCRGTYLRGISNHVYRILRQDRSWAR